MFERDVYGLAKLAYILYICMYIYIFFNTSMIATLSLRCIAEYKCDKKKISFNLGNRTSNSSNSSSSSSSCSSGNNNNNSNNKRDKLLVLVIDTSHQIRSDVLQYSIALARHSDQHPWTHLDDFSFS